MLFKNRSDAGRKLAERLLDYRSVVPIILALPRGGVPVAFEIAKALGAPLDSVLARKIGAPSHPELAVGAAVGLLRDRSTTQTRLRNAVTPPDHV